MTTEHKAQSFPVDSALLNAVLEHVDQGILMVDANGYVAVCNQRAIDLLGLPSDLMRSNPSFEDVKRWQLEQGEFGAVTETLLRAIKYEGIHVEILDYERQRPDGTVLEVRTNRLPNGGMVRTFTDITVRKAAENAIRVSEERLRLALQASRMAVWELDLQTQWVDRSENSLSLLGIRSGPVSDFIDRVHPDDQQKVTVFWHAVMSEGINATEVRYLTPDGKPTWLSLRAERKDEHRLIGISFDIADRKAAEEAIWRTANHDPLTGLANRALFQSRLEEALRHAEASRSGVGLLLLDLDDFKDINDTLGHAVGDRLLQEIALRLANLVRESDTVARVGGDEFAIILTGISEVSDATTRAKAIVEALRAPLQHEGQAFSTTVSIGLAAFPEHHRDPVELMKDADIALYRAKEQGRSRAVVYSSAARETIEHRVTIAREVREGLAAQQFRPDYQPKVSLTTGQIVGFEALARWQHPTKRLLTPAYFGSIFADQELSMALGEQMVRRVAADIRSWLDQDLDFGRVAVNLSSSDFSDPRLAARIIRILEEARIHPEYFEIEVTETVFLGRRTATASFILNELHRAGVSIALDDFGTGFASLVHLKQFPVDHIKIDQSFVRNLTSDRSDAAIVAAIVNLGHAMGIHTTAEGVENIEQAKRLREAGCDFAQGYLYAKPRPGAEVPKTIQTWSPVRNPGPSGSVSV
uniref:EAL domain-containing protein n=1 Tax=Bosea sp. NBC_00436 TaxID=2969620 RepID=A0A9E7ZQ67_9HYPH